jgi:uncharacterized protein (TIGR01319 family)
VEGDLGLRSGAAGVLEADVRWLADQSPMDEAEIGRGVALRGEDAKLIPKAAGEMELDRLLAVGCATHAIRRHCGTMLLSRGEGNAPPRLVRSGPDLREVERVIGTGGVFAHRGDGREVLEAALERRVPRSLSPREPEPALDSSYVLAAAGLLATHDPGSAMRLLRNELLSTEQETG